MIIKLLSHYKLKKPVVGSTGSNGPRQKDHYSTQQMIHSRSLDGQRESGTGRYVTGSAAQTVDRRQGPGKAPAVH